MIKHVWSLGKISCAARAGGMGGVGTQNLICLLSPPLYFCTKAYECLVVLSKIRLFRNPFVAPWMDLGDHVAWAVLWSSRCC